MSARGALGWVATVLVALLVLLALAVAVAVWLVTKRHEFEDRIQVPLPRQVGGTAPVWVSVGFQVHPMDLSVSTEATLRVAAEDFDAILPEREFSMLVGETDSPSVASMLGRLAFESGTGSLSGEGPRIEAGAGMAGEFYVRERREYAADEEQPDTGARMPFRARVTATFAAVGLSEGWELRLEGRSVSFELDAETRAAWRGSFGEGDHLADLVERTVTERAGSLFGRIEADGARLRPLLTEMVVARAEAHGEAESLGLLAFSGLEVDECPAVSGGDLSYSFAGLARLKLDNEGVEFSLPDLKIREGTCE